MEEFSHKSLLSVPLGGSGNFILRRRNFIYAYKRDGGWEWRQHPPVCSDLFSLADAGGGDPLHLSISPPLGLSVAHSGLSSCHWFPTGSLSPSPATNATQPGSVCKSRKKEVGFSRFSLKFSCYLSQQPGKRYGSKISSA